MIKHSTLYFPYCNDQTFNFVYSLLQWSNILTKSWLNYVILVYYFDLGLTLETSALYFPDNDDQTFHIPMALIKRFISLRR